MSRPPPPAGGRGRTIVVSSLEEVEALEAGVRGAAEAMHAALGALLAGEEPLEVVRAIKFGNLGFDPLDPSRPLNPIDQVHRTFAILTTLRAAAHLLREHPEHAPYHLGFGGAAGPDVASADGVVVAETVAVASPIGNNKLEFDLGRMRDSAAPMRYLFYHAAEGAGVVEDDQVRVVAVEL